jgi:hypothetical protein
MMMTGIHARRERLPLLVALAGALLAIGLCVAIL